MITTRLGQRMASRAGVLLVLVLAFTVLLVIVELKWGPVHRLDVRIDDSLHRTAVTDRDQTRWWRWVSNVLSPTVWRVLALGAAVTLWLRGRRPAAAFVVVAMAGAAALETVAKGLVGRARPVFSDPVAHAAGASFPSGHAMTSLTAFGLVIVMVAPKRRLAAIAVAVVAVGLVGFSRLALGVHYLSDVVGGWLLATAWLFAVDWFFRVRAADRSSGASRRRSARPAGPRGPGRPPGR
jgi:undecaprenyl-diphosphatase